MRLCPIARPTKGYVGTGLSEERNELVGSRGLQRKHSLHTVPGNDKKALIIQRFRKLRQMLKIANKEEARDPPKPGINAVTAAGQFSEEHGSFSSWIFTDLVLAFHWVLIIQAVMLMVFLWLFPMINGGLSVKIGKTVKIEDKAIQAEWTAKKCPKVFLFELP